MPFRSGASRFRSGFCCFSFPSCATPVVAWSASWQCSVSYPYGWIRRASRLPEVRPRCRSEIRNRVGGPSPTRPRRNRWNSSRTEIGDVLLRVGTTAAVILLGLWIPLVRLLRVRPIDNRPVRQSQDDPHRHPDPHRHLRLRLVPAPLARNLFRPSYWSNVVGRASPRASGATWAEGRQGSPTRSTSRSPSSPPQTAPLRRWCSSSARSTNRDHWSLYGYPRKTTPQLNVIAQDSENRLGVVRDAWSVDSSTVPAFRSMLTFPLSGAKRSRTSAPQRHRRLQGGGIALRHVDQQSGGTPRSGTALRASPTVPRC